MSNCEHKQTMIANDYQAEWCEDCGACRFRSNGKLDDWLYPKRPAASVVSVDEIENVIANVNDEGKTANRLLAKVIHALLTQVKGIDKASGEDKTVYQKVNADKKQ